MRALAKYILKKYNLQVSLDAVISAIRRFQSQEIFEEEDAHLVSALKDSQVSTKNNVVCLTITHPDNSVFSKAGQFLQDHPGARMTVGSYGFKLFVETRDVDDAKMALHLDKSVRVQTGLSQISIVAGDVIANMKGVAARITSELSLANINIKEMIICVPEFLIFVEERDTVQAHNSLLQLCTGTSS